jgi:hypothetical protein
VRSRERKRVTQARIDVDSIGIWRVSEGNLNSRQAGYTGMHPKASRYPMSRQDARQLVSPKTSAYPRIHPHQY